MYLTFHPYDQTFFENINELNDAVQAKSDRAPRFFKVTLESGELIRTFTCSADHIDRQVRVVPIYVAGESRSEVECGKRLFVHLSSISKVKACF